MKYLITVTAFILTIGLNYFYGFLPVRNNPEKPILVQGKADTTLVEGKTDTTKKISLSKYEKKLVHNEFETDTTYNFSLIIDSTIAENGSKVNYEIKTYPSIDSIEINFNFELISNEIIRTDTVFITRIDTIKTVSNESKPFYDTFLFGATISTAITTIIFLIK